MFWKDEDIEELRGTSIFGESTDHLGIFSLIDVSVDKIGRVEAERDYHEKLLPVIKVTFQMSFPITMIQTFSWLQSRPDIFLTASIEVHYSLQRYHIMGSRILSRSFHVEKWEGRSEESGDDQTVATIANGSDGLDVDIADQGLKEEERVDEVEDSGESDDEDEDPSDVAMVPLADILNARYRSENVRLLFEGDLWLNTCGFYTPGKVVL